MEVESILLGKLPFSIGKDERISLHVISSKIYILKIAFDKKVFVYSIADEKTDVNVFHLIWQSEIFSDCVVISNDGCMFIKSVKNDFYMYSIKNTTVEMESKMLFHQFKTLLDAFEFAECDMIVNLIYFLQRLVVLCLNNQWILITEWLTSEQPCVLSCTKLESTVSSCVANKEYIFSMTAEGALFIHKIVDGTLVQRIDIWGWLPWRESYRLLDVNEEPNTFIALLDPSNRVYIFDLCSVMNSCNNLKFDDSQSICSASSGVSYKTTSSYSSMSRTSSMAGSVVSKQISLKYSAADDLWLSYIQKLKKKQTHQGSSDKRLPSSALKLEDGVDGEIVRKISFTDVGVSVWATPACNTSGGSYRLYNTVDGQLIFSTSIPENCHVIPLRALTVSLDLLTLQDSLCLPLCSISKHAFINKMMQCIDCRYIKMLLEGWEDMLNPSNLLRSAVSEGHLDTVHLALNLHSHLFRTEILGEPLDGARTKDILEVLMEVVKNETSSEQFLRQIRGLQLTHSYRLLGLLDEVSIPAFMQIEVAVIRNQIMESIVAARAGLESGVEGSAPVPPEHSVEWVLWDGMSDMDVVRVGVTQLSAVQCFLAVKRGWTPEELSGQKFKDVVLSSALHLLEKRDIEGASYLLSHTGFKAEEELKTICLKSLNKKLTDFIVESLKDMWTDNELDAWHFLTLVTEVLYRHKQTTFDKHSVGDLHLSLDTIMLITDDKRHEIITELYFTTWDDSLIGKLTPEASWKHLIERNCTTGIQVWLGMKEPPYSHPWPLNLFSQWPITQKMIDSVLDYDCAESTKELVFNYLSLKGHFSSESKRNPQKILRRLAETRSLITAENILTDAFSTNFLSFACDSNLIEFAVSLHQQLPSILSLDSSQNRRHQVKWLNLWQSFINAEGAWNDVNILNIIQRTVDYFNVGSQDSYTKDHPLVLLALALIQDTPLLNINNDLLAISPLLAIGLPGFGDKADERRETTLYSLLSGTTAFHTDNLFLWQKDKNSWKNGDDLFPHFSCERLSIQYGHKECLNYVDYLKQARPSFAFVQFFYEFSNTQGNIPSRMLKRGTNVAHGLALQLFKDKDVGCSCVAFIEMLSRDSTPLRIHLACVDAVCGSNERGTNEIRTILQGIVMNKQESAEKLLKLLQEILHVQLIKLCGQDNVECLRLWQLPVMLANLHQLTLPESFLIFTAESNNWQLFITIVCLFHYPKWQVVQLIKNFKSVSLQEHFMYALQLKVDSQGHINNSGCSTRLIKNLNGPEQLFACVAEYGNSVEQLLTQARANQCPGFALVATCLQAKYLVPCFSEWLAASISKGHDSILPSNPLDWNSENVSLLLEEVVGLSYISTLHHAFSIFLSDNPLFLFTKFLKNTIEDKKFSEDVLEVEEFSNLLSSLTDDEENFISSKKWVSKTVIQLCSVALIKCFPSYFQQHQFLYTICSTALHAHLPVGNPDFELLLSLTECLEKGGLTLDFASVCVDYEHFHYEKQLEQLIYSHKFDVAHCFASTAGLPHDLILVVEWKEKAKLQPEAFRDCKFWEGCDAAFVSGGLFPDNAISFYLELAELCQSTYERYILLKFALKWIRSKPLNGSTKHQELLVLHDIYLCYLQESFDVELAIEDMCFNPLKCFRKDVVSQDTIDWFSEKFALTLTPSQIEKLDCVIGKLLSVGDVATVWCLEALFQYRNKDSLILDGCLGLAEGEFSPDDLPQNISQLLLDCSSSSRIRSSDSFSSPSSRMSHSVLSSYSLLEDFEEIDTEENLEREDILRVVNLFVEKAVSSSRLVQYIQSALRIGKKFNLHYKEVIEMQNPLVLIEKGCDDLRIAKDVIILANLPSDQTVFYLCSQIVKAVTRSEKWLSSCDELTDVLSLAEDPLQLGKMLLAAAASLTQCESFKQTGELLILAHSCFTKACNMEGISKVLKMCQKLTDILLQNCQWSLMVRLLTGIGRYNEMRYIFQLLKDNQQFESLLSKGLDKYTGLKSATLEFVRGDKELFTLVALHFRMYAELAAMFEKNASAYLDSLECISDGKIIRSDHNTQTLQAAIKAYSHAAQHCLQEKKLKKGTAIVNQAELAALQLSFLYAVEVGQLADCLLSLQKSQVVNLITYILSYEEACIVSRAYDTSVDWSAALYQQFIIKDNQHYFVAWSRHHDLNNTIVQDIVRRFQQEKALTDLMVKNMKHFIQMITQTDLRYRVCSQMGFKDLLQTLLSGPDLPYLKDTVWQSGFKKQHI